jgi:hypothetical protein
LAEIDEKLKPQNLKVSGSCLSLRMPKFEKAIHLPLDWIDKSLAPRGARNFPPPLFVSHCPFCGVSVRSKESGELPEDVAQSGDIAMPKIDVTR